MKVLMINGSPHDKGCTYTALKEVALTLEKHNIDSEILYLGKKPIAGCTDCGYCRDNRKCVFNDLVNETAARIHEFDGLLLGSPVYYAAASGQITAFLNRLFFSASRLMRGKPGAAVVSCRRGGAISTFDQLNKYFTISGMPVVPSMYWNQVHGFTPDEVQRDLEGLQTMRVLGENMAWMLRSLSEGKKADIPAPDYEKRIFTNFID
nr:flavodoxin family protein [uncultured Sphaerochaeta sp.]